MTTSSTGEHTPEPILTIDSEDFGANEPDGKNADMVAAGFNWAMFRYGDSYFSGWMRIEHIQKLIKSANEYATLLSRIQSLEAALRRARSNLETEGLDVSDIDQALGVSHE